ncbi:MAG: DUF1631 family protein, partial [Burkholderiales bacterium]|nr:DUF1631 family protein [Burkholderiales bacterium]
MQSRDLFRDRLCEAVGHMLEGADGVLSELAEKATDKDLQKHYLDARDVAASHRDVIESQFKQRYVADFQKRTNKAKKIAQNLSDFSLDELSLVEEDDLEQTLRFNDLAAKLGRHCEDELGALDQRVRVLLGDASLESDDNPFGPQVICDAYMHACQKVDCPVEIRTVFIKLVDDPVLDAIRASYKEVNELLVANSILPKIRYGITKSEGKAPPAPGAPPVAVEKEKAPQPAADGEDLFARLARMMAPGAA